MDHMTKPILFSQTATSYFLSSKSLVINGQGIATAERNPTNRVLQLEFRMTLSLIVYMVVYYIYMQLRYYNLYDSSEPMDDFLS